MFLAESDNDLYVRFEKMHIWDLHFDKIYHIAHYVNMNSLHNKNKVFFFHDLFVVK